jgi:hypothetical protein
MREYPTMRDFYDWREHVPKLGGVFAAFLLYFVLVVIVAGVTGLL